MEDITFKVRGNWSDRAVACRVAMALGTSGPLAWDEGEEGYPHWAADHVSDSDTSVVVMDKEGQVIERVATSVDKASSVSDDLRCKHPGDTVCIVPPEGKWDVCSNSYWLRRIDQGPPDEVSEQHVLKWPVRTFKLSARYLVPMGWDWSNGDPPRVAALKGLAKWLECDLVFGA